MVTGSLANRSLAGGVLYKMAGTTLLPMVNVILVLSSKERFEPAKAWAGQLMESVRDISAGIANLLHIYPSNAGLLLQVVQKINSFFKDYQIHLSFP